MSEKGEAQIVQLAERLRADAFLNGQGIELVAHSPLRRARQTCLGALGCVSANATSDERKVSQVRRVVELDALREKTPAEWLPGGQTGLDRRIDEFESWLASQPEASIAIVGHSQFFKRMLRLAYKFENCDVWECEFSLAADGGTLDAPLRWRKLVRLYGDQCTANRPVTVPH